jgi:quercetin dioxygenase-like cupin family protein
VSDDANAYVRQAGTAELRWLGDTSSYFLATGDQTAGSFALVDERANRGESVPLHRHRDDDEAFYVLDGELSLFVGDDPPARLGAGSFAFVPGGVVHGFRIESERARYLLLTTPRHGEFYRAISLPSEPGGGPPAEAVSGERIRAACEEFGIEFVGPLPD